MLGVGWQPYQPSHAFEDILTPVFVRALVIVIPCHIPETVYFPFPESLIIMHASNQLLDASPSSEAWEMHRTVFVFQHFLNVNLLAHRCTPTHDRFLLFTRHKQVVGIGLYVHVMPTLTVAFQFALHGTRSVESWRHGTFLATAEGVVVVETVSLRHCQRVQ
jgi:hypothetical protein